MGLRHFILLFTYLLPLCLPVSKAPLAMLSDCVAWTTSQQHHLDAYKKCKFPDTRVSAYETFAWEGKSSVLSSLPSHSDAWETWRKSPSRILSNPFHIGRHSKTQSQRQNTGVNPGGCLGCSKGLKEFLSKSAELPWHMLLHDRWEWSRQSCWLFHMLATVFHLWYQPKVAQAACLLPKCLGREVFWNSDFVTFTYM